MERIRLKLFSLLLILNSSPELSAEKLPLTCDFELDGIQYIESVPKPEAVIGHRIGERHTLPHQAVEYFRAVADASDRVVLRQHGETYEGRPLIHAIVTSPANQARLEKIRLANLRLSDSPATISDADLAVMPVIVWMGYSVHGNEGSGTEAALLLLYHLAAGRGANLESMLDQTVILIDPMLNPDGRSRFTTWINGNRGRRPTSDPADREHSEPWPGGRTNHYWFDLNRDWLPAQLVESQARLEVFHQWRPQFHTDFHEMGSASTYFFQPGVPKRANPNTPRRTLELTGEAARYHARALDRIGSLYYSGETFDDYYYGKGSSYPDINGAVGILFEQASARSLRREVPGGVLEYGFTIRNQIATSLSSLEAAVKMRVKLLDNQRTFYLESESLAEQNPVKAYLIRRQGNGDRDLELVDVLLRHRIRVFRLARDTKLGEIRFQGGTDFIIPTRQPQTRLLKTIMEKVDRFEDTVFYDISSWTFPLAMGVTVAELSEDPGPLVGNRVDRVVRPEGRIAGGRAEYAYLMEWGSFRAPAALYSLQDAGLETRLLLEPVTVRLNDSEERRLDRSAIVIPVAQKNADREEVHQIIEKSAHDYGIDFTAASTGLTSSGPDLGSPKSRRLEKPCIALISGPGIRSGEAGQAWFVLDYRMQIPVSVIDKGRLGRLDLDRYNTLILPSGNYSDLSEEVVGSLREWVRSGGLLIALRDAARWTVEQKLVPDTLREYKEELPVVSYAEASQQRRSQAISGAIFEVLLDPTHPVAYGLPERLPVFRNHQNYFELPKVSGVTVGKYSDSPLVSGYAPEGKVKAISGSAAIIARSIGSGAVILMADDPNFRACWLGTESLFLNAVMFGRAF